jgi:hypothetical protein
VFFGLSRKIWPPVFIGVTTFCEIVTFDLELARKGWQSAVKMRARLFSACAWTGLAIEWEQKRAAWRGPGDV